MTVPAVGTEFGRRWELYEMTYADNHEQIRIDALTAQRKNGRFDRHEELVEQCLSEYDESGWTVPDLMNPHLHHRHRPAGRPTDTAARLAVPAEGQPARAEKGKAGSCGGGGPGRGTGRG
ncbi:hypothetical protein [Streptomyces sp. NPDC088254]|uniref:hypothetical protein n=1 Tax=Streptomyces sp. NPDC088254 TaxID=3365847 RepID=UPI00382304F4